MHSAVAIWRKQKTDRKLLGKRGTILSWTDIYVAPPQYESQTPYTVVLVELEDKKRVYGQLIAGDAGKQIGQQVIAVLRVNGDVDAEDVISYAIKFKSIA